MKDENASNRAEFTQCDTHGFNTAEQGGVPGGFMYRSESLGCFVSENLLPGKRALHGDGAENRKKETNKASEEAETGLFEDIGEYFRIREQAQQVETEDETSSLERPSEREEGIQAEGHTRVTLYEKDICKSFER